MTQKELVVDILQELREHRELAEGMIALIDAGFMDKDTYTNLLFMISGAIKSLPEGDKKVCLKEKIDQLRSTKETSE